MKILVKEVYTWGRCHLYLAKTNFLSFLHKCLQYVKDRPGFGGFTENWENIDIKVAYITELEHEGDSLTHQVAAMLYRTLLLLSTAKI